MNPYDQMAELQRNWSPPRELAASGPRETTLSPAGMGLTVLAVVLFAGAIAASLTIENVARRQANEQKLLGEQGVETQGVIVRLWRGNDKSRQPMMWYQFQAGDAMYDKTVKVPLDAWRKLSKGSSLAVRYVPSAPDINRPSNIQERPVPHWVAVLAGVALAGLGVLLFWILRRARQLLSEGRPAPAVVTKHSAAQHGQKIIHYQFPLLGGGIGKGASGPQHRPIPVGGTLNVIYDRDNPRRNSPYPMELVRLAGARRVS